MRIVKYNNNNVFPSLINEFFNDDFGMNFLNRSHSVPSVNSLENNDSFEIDLAVPGMKKEDFTIELNDKVLVISSETSNTMENDKMRLNEFNFSSFQRSFRVPDSVDQDKVKASAPRASKQVSNTKSIALALAFLEFGQKLLILL